MCPKPVSCSNYMQLLKKGPPLLPKECAIGSTDLAASDEEWEEADLDGNLARYLQSFLRRIGCACMVHASLDGRNLVYYQAALRRDDWHRAREVLDSGIWRAHSSAYRSKYGGRNAPKITIRSEPRFREKPAFAPTGISPLTDKTTSRPRTPRSR